MNTKKHAPTPDTCKITRAWLATIAADRPSYPTAALYEGALLGTLAVLELLATGDPTSTLWHKLWRSECAAARLPTLSGLSISDHPPELPPLVLAALDPILHQALPTTFSAQAQTLAGYLAGFRIPHPDLPAEHIEGFSVECVTVYQRLRGMEPDQVNAWRLWRDVLAQTRRPGQTLSQAISGRALLPAPSASAPIRPAIMRIASTLESTLPQI